MSERHRPAPEGLEHLDLGELEHELVLRYRPEPLAQGGEHLIYEIPGRDDIVVKVEADMIGRIRRRNMERGQEMLALDDETKRKLEDHRRDREEGDARLGRYFGFERVPRMKRFIMKVPVTRELLESIDDEEMDEADQGTSEAWTVVKVQRRIPEMKDPARKSVVSGYVEHVVYKQPDVEAYRRATSVLVDGDESGEYSADDFEKVIVPRPMWSVLREAEHDPEFAAGLKDFTERAVRYTNETGEILDLAGGDNVIFAKKDGRWDFRLVDALYPGRPGLLDRARQAAEELAQGLMPDGNKVSALLNAVNYARLVNGLAKRFGLSDRIDLIPESAKGKIDYLAIFRRP